MPRVDHTPQSSPTLGTGSHWLRAAGGSYFPSTLGGQGHLEKAGGPDTECQSLCDMGRAPRALLPAPNSTFTVVYSFFFFFLIKKASNIV